MNQVHSFVICEQKLFNLSRLHITNPNINFVHRFVYSTSTANNTLILLIRGQMYVWMYACCDMCTIYVYRFCIHIHYIHIHIYIYRYNFSLFFTFITLQNISFADDASALSPYNTIANYTFFLSLRQMFTCLSVSTMTIHIAPSQSTGIETMRTYFWLITSMSRDACYRRSRSRPKSAKLLASLSIFH